MSDHQVGAVCERPNGRPEIRRNCVDPSPGLHNGPICGLEFSGAKSDWRDTVKAAFGLATARRRTGPRTLSAHRTKAEKRPGNKGISGDYVNGKILSECSKNAKKADDNAQRLG
jgi:hypothetical protein